MKRCLLLIFFIGMSIECRCQQAESPDYIEIEYTGVQENPISNLVLSIENIRYDINCNCFVSAKNRNDYPDKKSIPDLIAFKYDFITINKKTFDRIFTFVNAHQRFYANDANTHLDEYDNYTIHMCVDGHTYKPRKIYYKLKDRFFDDLIACLQKLPHDNRIIEAIRRY
jgi:hypothetical protein